MAIDNESAQEINEEESLKENELTQENNEEESTKDNEESAITNDYDNAQDAVVHNSNNNKEEITRKRVGVSTVSCDSNIKK